MGTFCSRLCGCTPLEHPTDKAAGTTLDAPEVAALRKSIKKIANKENIVPFGLSVFRQMFIEYSYTRDYFPNYHTCPSDMKYDRRMVCHGVVVIKFLQTLIEHTHDVETLKAMMEMHARYHLKRAVTSVEMELFHRILMMHLKEHPDWKNSARRRERLWNKLLLLMMRVYNQAEDRWFEELPPAIHTERIFEREIVKAGALALVAVNKTVIPSVVGNSQKSTSGDDVKSRVGSVGIKSVASSLIKTVTSGGSIAVTKSQAKDGSMTRRSSIKNVGEKGSGAKIASSFARTLMKK